MPRRERFNGWRRIVDARLWRPNIEQVPKHARPLCPSRQHAPAQQHFTSSTTAATTYNHPDDPSSASYPGSRSLPTLRRCIEERRYIHHYRHQWRPCQVSGLSLESGVSEFTGLANTGDSQAFSLSSYPERWESGSTRLGQVEEPGDESSQRGYDDHGKQQQQYRQSECFRHGRWQRHCHDARQESFSTAYSSSDTADAFETKYSSKDQSTTTVNSSCSCQPASPTGSNCRSSHDSCSFDTRNSSALTTATLTTTTTTTATCEGERGLYVYHGSSCPNTPLRGRCRSAGATRPRQLWPGSPESSAAFAGPRRPPPDADAT